jgi:oligopeptide transport system substrate-binding protein
MNIQSRKRLFLVALCSAVLLGPGCGQRKEARTAIRRGIGADIANFDPQLAADVDSYEVLRDLYEGLTAETPVGGAEPAAASGWTVSEDGRTYVFTLRPNLKWSNGDLVDATEYVAAIQRALNPDTGSASAGLLDCLVGASEVLSRRANTDVLGVRALDAKTIEFQLVRPANYFPSLLANPVAFPNRKARAPTDQSSLLKPGTVISNGPYTLTGRGPGSTVHLVKNEFYWDKQSVRIAAVDYFPVDDAKAELNRYRAGELDVTSVVPPADFEWLKKTLPGELQSGPELGVYFFAFNLAQGPLAKTAQIRQALALALDRDATVEHALKAGQRAAYSLVPPGIPGYAPSQYDWTGDDPGHRRERARALMRSAGVDTAHPLHLRLIYAQGETVRNLVIAAAAQWHEALGVEVEPLALEFRSFLALRNDRSSWDVLVNGWNADYPDPGNFLEVFRAGGVQNDPALADAAYDGLLDRARDEADGGRRLAIYREAEQHLLATYAVTPVYFVATRRLVKPYVHGVVLNPMNHNYTKHWWMDAVPRR